MPGFNKFLLGGLGAVVPTVASLAVVDLEPVITRMTLAAGLGLLVKIVLLFMLGGIWAWLHKQENQRAKVFELGIVAPATILTLQNGIKAAGPVDFELGFLPAVVDLVVADAHAEPPHVSMVSHQTIGTIRGEVVSADGQQPVAGAHVRVRGTDIGTLTDEDGGFVINVPAGARTLIVTAAGFSPNEQPVQVVASRATDVRFTVTPSTFDMQRVFVQQRVSEAEPPLETRVQQFLRGFLGRADPRVWHVTGEEYDTRDMAINKVQQYIAALDNPDAARVYEEPDSTRAGQVRYVIVFGTNLTYEQAAALRQRVEELGLCEQPVRIRRR